MHRERRTHTKKEPKLFLFLFVRHPLAGSSGGKKRKEIRDFRSAGLTRAFLGLGDKLIPVRGCRPHSLAEFLDCHHHHQPGKKKERRKRLSTVPHTVGGWVVKLSPLAQVVWAWIYRRRRLRAPNQKVGRENKQTSRESQRTAPASYTRINLSLSYMYVYTAARPSDETKTCVGKWAVYMYMGRTGAAVARSLSFSPASSSINPTASMNHAGIIIFARGVVFKPSIQLAARTDQETGPSRAAMEEIDRDPEYVYKRPALPASRPSNIFLFFKFYFVIHDQKERYSL
jgi:hypothetical protein